MDVRGILGIDSDVRNGFSGIKVTYNIDADASPDDIKALVAQSQKRSAVYDIITNPTNVTVEVALTAAPAGRRAVRTDDGRHRRRPRRARDEPLPRPTRSIDHVVLERGEVANSWRTERWDSLPLLTPNWQSRLPGYRLRGRRPRRLHDDARGHRVHRAATPKPSRAPVQTDTTVTSVRRDDDGYRGRRPTKATWQLPDRRARIGACNVAARPAGRRARAAGDHDAHADAVPQRRTSSPRAACWWSARRRPASRSPTRSSARAVR